MTLASLEANTELELLRSLLQQYDHLPHWRVLTVGCVTHMPLSVVPDMPYRLLVRLLKHEISEAAVE